MHHLGDLLLCHQNGNMLHGHTCIGPGEEGLNSFQQINALIDKGFGSITKDDDYFVKQGNQFFHGTSELELSIQQEMKAYLEIWENVYFLRTLTQVVRVANGERYDWLLDMYNLGTNKSNHVRDKIIKKLDVCPKFKKAMEIAYIPQIRNAVAHSQYHVIQGGIWLDNYKPNKPGDIQAIGFEQWEKIYVYSYYIFRGLLHNLWEVVQQLYLPLTKMTTTGGIPVLAYCDNDHWEETYIYPDITGGVWRFTPFSPNV